MSRISCVLIVLVSLFRRGAPVEENCLDHAINPVIYSATDSDSGFPASDAVLNDDGAWCTSTVPPGAYLQVNFDSMYDVCALQVQGFTNSSGHDFYTTKYRLSYSISNNVWSYFKNGTLHPAEFSVSPSNGSAIETLDLSSLRLARVVRLHPIETNDAITCLRVAAYGTRVLNITCDNHQMTISIRRGGLGPDLANLSMNDASPDCTFDIPQDSDMTFSIQVGSCGTHRAETPGYFYFTNTVHGRVQSGDVDKITRTYDVTFDVNCTYRRSGSVSSNFVPNQGFSITGTAYGDLLFTMTAYSDASRTDLITASDQPLALDTPLYVRVRVNSSDTNLTLHLRQCWATTGPNSNNEPQKQLIEDGCVVDVDQDDTIAYSCDGTSIQDFQFNTFRFTDFNTVYIHCRVLVCFSHLSDSVCREECDNCTGSSSGRLVRRSVDENGYDSGSGIYSIKDGPFRLKDLTNKQEKDSTSDQTVPDQTSQTGLSDHVVTVISVSGVVVLIVLCATIVTTVLLLRKRRNTPPPSNLLKEPAHPGETDNYPTSIPDIWVRQ